MIDNDRGQPPPGGNRPQFAIDDKVECTDEKWTHYYRRIGVVVNYIYGNQKDVVAYVIDFGINGNTDIGSIFSEHLQLSNG